IQLHTYTQKDLFNNNLTRIPSHLTNSIEYLDVSHNNISSIVHGDLSGLTNLCFLKVTHCGLQYISPDAFSSNSEIKVLNISYNHLTVIPNLHLPQLRILDLSTNLYPSYALPVFPALRNLSLSHNLSTLISIGKPCFWLPHLIELSLSHNNLGNDVFHYLSPYFQKIDLSKTGINVIPLNIISSFPRRTLHIDQNAITCISQKSMEGFPKLRSLKAGHKPFSCDCDSFWFMMVYNKSLLSDWSQDNSCSTPPSFSGRRLETYEHGWLSCQLGLQAAVVLSVLSVVVVALAIIVYACDGIWYTKMLWGWIRVKRRGYKRADRLLNATFRYHAFISYSQHDSTWVGSQLVPELERSGLSLCVHERDFEPGKWIVDNIIHCVEDSYKSLFILAKHFVQSELCNYELFFAQHRAISVNDDSLVFVLLEHIPTDSLPKKFLKLRILLRRKTYLEWPTDERKQRVFWGNLKAILQTVDQKRRKKY
uniref:TIR domain-containing protein n=1 Tax=Sinocyclocheilus grahami TaxID=75366 RepID=A0A672K133_SINGR